jgi:hypothetical protein
MLATSATEMLNLNSFLTTQLSLTSIYAAFHRSGYPPQLRAMKLNCSSFAVACSWRLEHLFADFLSLMISSPAWIVHRLRRPLSPGAKLQFLALCDYGAGKKRKEREGVLCSRKWSYLIVLNKRNIPKNYLEVIQTTTWHDYIISMLVNHTFGIIVGPRIFLLSTFETAVFLLIST